MGFAITPVVPATPRDGLLGNQLQVRNEGVDVGDPNVLVIDFIADPTEWSVTRGWGEDRHIVTVKRLQQGDPHFANVGYLLHFDDTGTPQSWIDVLDNTWARQNTPADPTNLAVVSTNPKWGAGSLKMKTVAGNTLDFTLQTSALANGSYSLGPGNQFTIEGWMYWSGNVDSRAGYGEVLSVSSTVICGIVFHTTNQIKFRTTLNGSTDDRVVSPPLNQWVHVALTYDGTTKRWFVNGVLQGSAAVTAGVVQTVGSYRVQGIASGNGAAPIAYMDDLRFTFGVCRYTANFPVPTEPFKDF